MRSLQSHRQANVRMPFTFPKKEEIIGLMTDIEEFNRLKKTLEEAGLNEP